MGGTGGNGGQPPTRPPFVTKPTPASKPFLGQKWKDTLNQASNPNLHPDANGDNTPDGTSDDDTFTSESESAFPDVSFADPCVTNKGPRAQSSSSYIYPVQCPSNLDNNLPIHPLTHFMTRNQCTQGFLQSLQERLRNNQAELTRLRQQLEFEVYYLRTFENSQQITLKKICERREEFPTKSFLSLENIERAKLACEANNQNRQQEIEHLEFRYDQLLRIVNRELAEVSAIQFGINFRAHHPNDEFVIFIREDGHIVQRTNRYHLSRFEIDKPITTTTTTEFPPETFGPNGKKHPSSKPRDKRSNVETNHLTITPQLNATISLNQTRSFEVIRIDHAFEMLTLYKSPKNMLIVFPDQKVIFKALTQTMDNKFVMLHDLIKGYYANRYDSSLAHTTSAYFKFTTELENSSIDIKFKKQFILDLNDFLKQQMDSNLRWYYDPLHAIEDINTKILSVEHEMFSIRI